MQINKPKKRSRQQSSSALFDEDFAAGFEDGKFDTFKPAPKVLVTVILLIGATWGVVAYFNKTGTENGQDKIYTPTTTQQAEDSSATEGVEVTDIQQQNSSSNSRSDLSSPEPSSNANQQHSNNSSSPVEKTYDPSKCEPYNDESKMWRTEADNTYAIIKQATDSGGSVPDSVMDTWKDQLDRGNKAYEKFQQCRASL